MGLRRQLSGIIPEAALRQVSDHFEVIGDIAITALHPALHPYRQEIAETIISHRRNILAVLNKVEDVTGNARTARYETLIGDTTVTTHHEFGFAYRMDVARVFFNTRLAYERQRVTEQAEPGETVYVPFAGVGPFAIPAAARGAAVLAVEQNPDAFGWLNENIHLNRVREHCHALPGDVFDPALLPGRRFDRIICPTPYGMDRVLDILLPCLARGGMIHFYTFRTQEEIPGLIAAYRKQGLEVTYYTSCGNVAPGVSRWVFDLASSHLP
jgi:tRNA (guanine37-N1)-methyltransferase